MLIKMMRGCITRCASLVTVNLGKTITPTWGVKIHFATSRHHERLKIEIYSDPNNMIRRLMGHKARFEIPLVIWFMLVYTFGALSVFLISPPPLLEFLVFQMVLCCEL